MDGNEGFQERIIPAEGTVGLLQLIAAKLAGMNVSADKVSAGAGGVTLRNGAIRAVLGELARQGGLVLLPRWPRRPSSRLCGSASKGGTSTCQMCTRATAEPTATTCERS